MVGKKRETYTMGEPYEMVNSERYRHLIDKSDQIHSQIHSDACGNIFPRINNIDALNREISNLEASITQQFLELQQNN